MELPVLTEITNFPLTRDELWNYLIANGLGEKPLYIDLTFFPIERQEYLLTLFKETIMGSSFQTLPYPLYIITPNFKERPPLELISSTGQLPGFYRIKKRKLLITEESVMNKIEIIKTKIKSYDQASRMNILFSHRKERRYLKELTNQIDFLTKTMNEIGRDY